MEIEVNVDRPEGNFAILLIRPEAKQEINWPLKHLSRRTPESDIIFFNIDKNIEKTEDAEKQGV